MSDAPEHQERVYWWPAAWEGSVPMGTLVDVVSRHPVFSPGTAESLFGSQDEPAEVALVLPEGTYGVLARSPSYEADDQVSVTVLAASVDWPVLHGWCGLLPLVTELGLTPWDAEPPPGDMGIRDLFLDNVVEAWHGWHFALPSGTAGIEAVLRAAMATFPAWRRQGQEERYIVAYTPSQVRRLTLYGADVALVLPAKRLVLDFFGSSPLRVTGFTGWVALAWAWLFPLTPQRTELALGSAESPVGKALKWFVKSRWPEAQELESLDDLWGAALAGLAAAQAPGGEGAFSDPAVLSVLERIRGKKRDVATLAVKGLPARAIYDELRGTVPIATIRSYLWEFRTKEQYKALRPYLCPPDEAYSAWGRQAHSRAERPPGAPQYTP